MLCAATVLALIAACAARSPLIINGKDTIPGEHPWQVSLQLKVYPWAPAQHFCGGALIDRQWVLTAAHCTELLPPGVPPFTVVTGLHTQSEPAGATRHKVAKKGVYAHKDFDLEGNFITDDIALVKLDKPVELKKGVAEVIPMSVEGDNFDGQECKMTGWGKTDGYDNTPADTLQEITTTSISREKCESMWQHWPWYWTIKNSHICFWTGKNGACQGDSGGPAVCKKDGSWVLAGITSGGNPNCSVRTPSIYSRVSYFRKWIKAHSGL